MTTRQRAQAPRARRSRDTIEKIDALLTLRAMRGLNAEIELGGHDPTNIAYQFLAGQRVIIPPARYAPVPTTTTRRPGHDLDRCFSAGALSRQIRGARRFVPKPPLEPKPPWPRSLSRELLDLNHGRRGHSDQHQLRDPVARLERARRLAVGVQQQNLELAPVAGVDQSGRVHQRDPVTRGQS